MNFDLENPYIEFESNDIPHSLYEIYGVNKIKELSRQLRTFLNYKAATIQYRFCLKNITCLERKNELFKETKKSFETVASKFIKLLVKIKGTGVSYEAELKRLTGRFFLTEDKNSHSLLVDLRDITKNLFIYIHALSEQEIYLDPKLLKIITILAQDTCIVYKIINEWASEFYDELRVNYLQLHSELSIIIPEVEKVNIGTEKKLEEGLKEW